MREANAEEVMDHLDEGFSVRSTPRLKKMAKETVARLLKTSGRHAQRFHGEEKQKHYSADEAGQASDFWDHTAMVPDSKLIVSLVAGHGTQEQTQELVSDTQSRLCKGGGNGLVQRRLWRL